MENIEVSCSSSGLAILSFSIIIAGIFTVFMEMVTNKISSHLYSCSLIIVVGLSLFTLGIFVKIFKDFKTSYSVNIFIKTLLAFNFIVNLIGLIYFCYILSKNKNTMEIQVQEVVNYIIPYLKAFLITIIVIIIINMNIYNYIICMKSTLQESTNMIIIFLAIFSSIECGIEIIFLLIIARIFNGITDG
jgi:hypothetical protein